MKKIPFLLFVLIAFFFTKCKKESLPTINSQQNGLSGNPVFYAHEGWIGANDNSSLLSIDNNIIVCGNSLVHILD